MPRERMKKNPLSVSKQPIDPSRIRRIPPEGFSWIDRRFVRQGFIEDLPREAILLYFFLVAVSDADGLSFYADPTVSRLLKLSAEELTQARYWLEKAGLVLYRYPFYQVLALPPRRAAPKSATTPSARGPTPTQSPATGRGGDPMSLGELLALLVQQRPAAESRKEGSEQSHGGA